MNLLTYDYHSAFEPAVNHHAPLYPLEEPNEYSTDAELNIVSTATFLLLLKRKNVLFKDTFLCME